MSKKHRNEKLLRCRRKRRAGAANGSLSLSSHRVTFERLPKPDYDALPADAQVRLTERHALKTTEPERAIRELSALKRPYLQVPQSTSIFPAPMRLPGIPRRLKRAFMKPIPFPKICIRQSRLC
ncbi:MAG: hypothetical protein GY801_46955 [bacterium]|nr:hypothetical protein [bacterium]